MAGLRQRLLAGSGSLFSEAAGQTRDTLNEAIRASSDTEYGARPVLMGVSPGGGTLSSAPVQGNCLLPFIKLMAGWVVLSWRCR